MWPFKRKSKEPTVPTEVQDYYQSERRERIGIAWLLALATLVTTVVLAVGLFFGGRWVYRKVAQKSNKPTTVATQNNQSKHGSTAQNQPTSQSKPTQSNSGQAQSAAPTNNSADQNPEPNPQDITVSDNGSSDNLAAGTGSNTATTQTARGAPLPNTGPGDTLKIFVVVTTMATLGHYAYSRRKQTA